MPPVDNGSISLDKLLMSYLQHEVFDFVSIQKSLAFKLPKQFQPHILLFFTQGLILSEVDQLTFMLTEMDKEGLNQQFICYCSFTEYTGADEGFVQFDREVNLLVSLDKNSGY